MGIVDLAIARAVQALTSSTEPAQGPRIGQSGPPAGIVMPGLHVRTTLLTRPALDADTRKIVSIYASADQGYLADLADLFEDTRTLDSRLDGVARKRVLAIEGRPFVIKPAAGFEDDAEAKKHAEIAQRKIAGAPGFHSAIAHLAHATLYGWSVCETEWYVDRDGHYVPRLHMRLHNLFGVDENLSFGFVDRRGQRGVYPLADFPDKFVLHSPVGGRSSLPWRRGAMYSRTVPSIAKRAGWRWYVQVLERFGQPVPFARVPQGQNDDGSTDGLVATIKQGLRDLNTDWAAVLTGDISLDVIPGTGTPTGEAQAKFIEMMNTEDAITILGVNLTTEVKGGSFAATESQRFVGDDILEADCIELARETLTQQVVEPFNRYNWPGGPPLEAELITTRRQPFSENDVANGTCSPDERRQSLGWTALPDGKGKDLVASASAQAPAAIGAAVATDAAATVQDTALNGAQVQSLQGIVVACASGQLPISAAKVMIAKAFPAITQADIDAMFVDVVPSAAPVAAGGGTPPPFPSSAQTTSPAPTPTSGRSTHPLASALSRR